MVGGVSPGARVASAASSPLRRRRLAQDTFQATTTTATANGIKADVALAVPVAADGEHRQVGV